jgi:hypothetical protein
MVVDDGLVALYADRFAGTSFIARLYNTFSTPGINGSFTEAMFSGYSAATLTLGAAVSGSMALGQPCKGDTSVDPLASFACTGAGQTDQIAGLYVSYTIASAPLFWVPLPGVVPMANNGDTIAFTLTGGATFLTNPTNVVMNIGAPYIRWARTGLQTRVGSGLPLRWLMPLTPNTSPEWLGD